MELKKRGEYYVIYHQSKNAKKCILGIKFPSLKAPLYLKLGGRRAKDLYKYIVLTLDNLGISYLNEKENFHEILKVPWATGLAITAFLLAVYSKRRPLTYAHVLNRMLTGDMPLARHLVSMIEMALDLSEYLGNIKGGPLITHKSAMVISKAITHVLSVMRF